MTSLHIETRNARRGLLCVLGVLVLALISGRTAPVPSRSIGSDLDPLDAQRWEWAQGETVYLSLTSRVDLGYRDLTGSTCWGVLYAGTNVYLYSTGTVSSATGGAFACTIAAADSNLQTTNDYVFAFWASGATSSAFMGKADVTVRYSPDAGSTRVTPQDYLSTATIITGGVYLGSGSVVSQSAHKIYISSGTGDMASNDFVTGSGVVKTSAVALALLGAGSFAYSNTIVLADVANAGTIAGAGSNSFAAAVWTNAGTTYLITKVDGGTQYFGISWGGTNSWWRIAP